MCLDSLPVLLYIHSFTHSHLGAALCHNSPLSVCRCTAIRASVTLFTFPPRTLKVTDSLAGFSSDLEESCDVTDSRLSRRRLRPTCSVLDKLLNSTARHKLKQRDTILFVLFSFNSVSVTTVICQIICCPVEKQHSCPLFFFQLRGAF